MEQQVQMVAQADAFSARLENASVTPSGVPSLVPIPPDTVAARALETQSVVATLQNQVCELLAERDNNNNNNKRRGKNRRGDRSGRGGGRRGPPEPRTKRRWSNQNYCWTYGCDPRTHRAGIP